MSAMQLVRDFKFTGEMTSAEIVGKLQSENPWFKRPALQNAICTLGGGRWLRSWQPGSYFGTRGGKFLYRMRTHETPA